MSAGLDHSEEMLADADEPPDQGYFGKVKHNNHAPGHPFSRAQLLHASRRESLLTRQLNSENDQSTEEDEQPHSPVRGLSTISFWSTQSTTSTAELTSDDGRSVPSPTTSPPLRPTASQNGFTVPEKPLSKEPRILGLEAIKAKDPEAEKSLEAGLGRKRCITFACGNKDKEKPPTPPPSTEEDKPASPPKRKCTIKFACPARAGAENKPAELVTSTKRPVSPPPPQRRTSQQTKSTSEKTHRGSDSTVTHVSPKNVRKPSEPVAVVIKKDETPKPQRKLSNGSDSGGEGTRFHEFATSDEEPEEWIQESTCWRSRLTVSDTLKKENVIRQLGEEVDEEALEEDDEDDDEDDDDEDPADEDDDEVDIEEDEEDEEDEEEEDSDDGFHSDDEEGFAVSDSDGEDSENEWWTPAGRSTAATSMDHLDHFTINHFKSDRSGAASSVNSASSRELSPRSSLRQHRHRNHSKSEAVDIQRPGTPDLPDSTDFVCGTLDEDRPLEQAYITRMKEREAAKHKVLPQDIDPTFPTSDPEMDEEDDEDIEDPEESESEAIVHGDMEQINGDERRPSFTPRRRSQPHRSPPPPTRHRSPAPRRPSPAPVRRSNRRSPPPRAGSPAPRRPSPAPVRRSNRRSPPPRAGSPAPRRASPAPVRRSTCRSPPPPAKRGVNRSPAPPRKLFGQSPQRMRSAAQGTRMTSPPNTRRTSPSEIGPTVRPMGIGLGARPAPLTHTASLPRAGGFQISRMDRLEAHDIDEGSDTAGEVPMKKRGAIDIVKGLEKKRLRRKEKMHQKACAKAAAKGDKAYKVKPGKGCERMREVGLELQRYKGKGEHILSV